MIAERDSLKLAKLDCKSVVVFGIPADVSILAIARILDRYVRAPRLPPRKRPVLGIERAGDRERKTFTRIIFSDTKFRDAFFPNFTALAKSLGWVARKGRPLSERRLLRQYAKGRPAPEGFQPSENLYSPLQKVQDPPLSSVPQSHLDDLVVPAPHFSTVPAAAGRKRRRRLYNGSKLNALRLGSINLNGCRSTKAQELALRAEALHLDILAVQETHLFGSATFPSPYGFVWYGKNGERNKENGHAEGGVGFLVRDYLVPFIERVRVRAKDQMWIKLRGRKDRRDLALGCVYMPCTSRDAETRKKAFKTLNKHVARIGTSSDVVILGDFNARPENNHKRVGSLHDAGVNSNGKLLIELLDDRDLWSTTSKSSEACPPTYERRNAENDWIRTNIDFILVGRSLRRKVSSEGVDDTPERVQSDHRLLWAEFADLNYHARSKPETPSKKWRVEKLEDPEIAKEYAREVDRLAGEVLISGVLEGDDVDKACEECSKVFDHANEKLLGHKVVTKGKTAPWFTNEIRLEVRERIRLFKEYSRLGGDALWTKYTEKRTEIKKLARKAKKGCWNDFVKTMESDLGKNPRRFWMKAKRLLKSGKKAPPMSLKNNAGELVSQPSEVLEAFAEHYEELGKPSPDDEIFDREHHATITSETESLVQRQTAEMADLDCDFTESEVEKVIRKMKNGAAGCDLIRPQMLKAATGIGVEWSVGEERPHAALTLLTSLGSLALRTGKMPEVWQKGQIFNIFKKDEPTDRGNYRGITLLSVVGKVVTRVMADRISRKAEEKGWIAEEQGGFRPGRRTEDQILILHRVLLNRRLTKKHTCVFFLDQRKAYDTVWRDGLLHKLYGLGVTGRLFGLIKSMYSNTTSTVVGPGGESRAFPISEGVRQGDPLSCVLFNLFINDLVEEVKSSGVESPLRVLGSAISALLFADDVAIPCASISDMAKVLRAVENHSSRWRWKANVGKSKLMWVKGRGKPDPKTGKQPLSLYGESIPWVEEYPYLGVTLTQDLSWDRHVDIICEAARKRARKWKHLLSMPQLHRSARVLFYKSIIRPKLEFATSVWTPNSKQAAKLEAVQLECLRWVIPCSASTRAWPVRSELGVLRLSTRRTKLLLRYWFDIHSRYDSSRLARKVATWKLKCKSTGMAPAGLNRILADEAFAEMKMDKNAWLEKILAEAVPEVRGNHGDVEKRESLRATFDQQLRENTARLDTLACKKEMAGSMYASLTCDKATQYHEPYLMSNSFGALLKFRFRSGAHSLGKSFVDGAMVHAPCPSCHEQETLQHFLEECSATEGLRAELMRHAPFKPSDLLTKGKITATLLQNHQPKPAKRSPKDPTREVDSLGPMEARTQDYLVACWRKRGEALGLRPEPAPAAPVRDSHQPKRTVWQPVLARFFARKTKPVHEAARAPSGGVGDAPSSHSRDGVNGSQHPATA